MPHALTALPYDLGALAPLLSEEAVAQHYCKHQAACVSTLNRLVFRTAYDALTLTDILFAAEPGPLFDHAAEVWNHTFYWQSMTPDPDTTPSAELAGVLAGTFGSMQGLRDAFLSASVDAFGSAWAWLVIDADAGPRIVVTADAYTPLTGGLIPLLACDLWEHAHYLDYPADRAAYVQAWWRLVNWENASRRFVGHPVIVHEDLVEEDIEW